MTEWRQSSSQGSPLEGVPKGWLLHPLGIVESWLSQDALLRRPESWIPSSTNDEIFVLILLFIGFKVKTDVLNQQMMEYLYWFCCLLGSTLRLMLKSMKFCTSLDLQNAVCASRFEGSDSGQFWSFILQPSFEEDSNRCQKQILLLCHSLGPLLRLMLRSMKALHELGFSCRAACDWELG